MSIMSITSITPAPGASDELHDTASAPALTAYLARSRTAGESADSGLFEGVAAQAQAARASVTAVGGHSDTSRTALWAGTPTSRAAAPPAGDEPGRGAPTVAGPWAASATVDPADWMSSQLQRFSQGDRIDPYAELMLRRAGFAPVSR